MNFNNYKLLLDKVFTFICYFFYSFFISSFIYIYICKYPFLNSSLIESIFHKYIAYSTIFDFTFLFGIISITYLSSLLFNISNMMMQLLLLIIISSISVFVLFDIILPIISFNNYTTLLLSNIKKQNIYCHYVLFSLFVYLVLYYFKSLQRNY